MHAVLEQKYVFFIIWRGCVIYVTMLGFLSSIPPSIVVDMSMMCFDNYVRPQTTGILLYTKKR